MPLPFWNCKRFTRRLNDLGGFGRPHPHTAIHDILA